jgi:hypothetical protein
MAVGGNNMHKASAPKRENFCQIFSRLTQCVITSTQLVYDNFISVAEEAS